MATSVTSPVAKALGDPRSPSGTIEQQISAAIAAGFQTVIDDRVAQQREMTEAARELREAAQIMKRVAREDSVASGDALATTRATPSANTARHRGHRNVQVADAVIHSAEQYLREDIGGKIASSPSYGNSDYSAAVASGGISGLESTTRQGLRNSVFNSIGKRVLSTIPANPGDLTKIDAQGRMHDPSGMFLHSATGYVQGADGTTQLLGPNVSMDSRGRFRDMTTGQFVGAADAAVEVENASMADSLRHYNRTMAMRSVAMGGLDAWRSGQPVGRALMAGMPAGALKAAGVAGAAWHGFQMVQGKVKNYDDEFNRMRQVYGGDNWDAAGEKFDRFKSNIQGRLVDAFGFTSVGGLKEREAFDQAAMGHGFRGNRREQYTDEAINLRHQGVGADQINQIFSIATDAGHSLDGFVAALKLVKETARDAGINATRAREIFIKNYEASSEFMFSGEKSKMMAAGQAAAQVTLGRRFGDIDLTGTFTNANMDYLFAARTGQTINDFRSQADADPGQRVIQSEDWLKTQLGYVTSSKNGKRFPQIVAEFEATLGTTYKPDAHGTSLGAWITREGIPIEVVNDMVQQTGVEGMSMSDAVIYAGQLFIKGFMTPGAQAQATTDAQNKAMTPFKETGEKNNGYGGVMFEGGPNAPTALESAYATGIDPGKPTSTVYENNLDYLQDFRGDDLIGVQRYPLVEQMLREADKYGITSTTKVAVQTKDGWREVEMWQAVGDFPDQLQSGVARIISGAKSEWLGRSLPEVLGVIAIGTTLDPSLQINSGSSSQSYSGGTPTDAPSGATGFGSGIPTSGGMNPGMANNSVQIVMDPRLQGILQAVVIGDPYSPSPRKTARAGVMIPT